VARVATVGGDAAKRAEPAHAIQETMRARWSPYGFVDRSLPVDELRCVLEAARWSASSYNEQPWRFTVARREEGEPFERLVSCLVEANRGWAQHASALALGIVVRNFSGRDEINPAAEHDLGLATAHLMLEGSARGIATHAMIGIDAARARRVFSIPQGFDPLTAIAFGYAGPPRTLRDYPDKLRERDCAPRERKALAEFVYGVEWGRAARCLVD
jgi:nitroreductase